MFGAGESSINNSTTDPGTQARISFTLNGVTGAHQLPRPNFKLNASGLNHLAETNNPNSTKIVNTDANLILRTGSLGLAIAAKPGATGIAQTPGSSHSGLSNNGLQFHFGIILVAPRGCCRLERHRIKLQAQTYNTK